MLFPPKQSCITMRMFCLCLPLLLTPPVHAHMLTEAATTIENSYVDATTYITNTYEAATDRLRPSQTQWNWQTIDTKNIAFPATFFWGIATTEQTPQIPFSSQETTPMQPIAQINPADLKQAGINMYMVFIDWSTIEPQENNFNTDILDQYATFCCELKKYNITPLIVLFDTKAPQWFTDKKGFLVYENSTYFVRFAEKVFSHLQQNNTYWIPFLNPDTYAADAHVYDIANMLNTFEHMLIAHKNTYHSLKKIINNNHQLRNTSIGITKNMNTIEPWNILNPLHRLKARKLNLAFHDSFYNFINKGMMNIYFNEITKDSFTHSTFNSFDFIGVSYTSPRYVDTNYTLTNNTLTRTPRSQAPHKYANYHSYSEGLYQALMTATQKLNKKAPIIVLQSPLDAINSAVNQTQNKANTLNPCYQQHLYSLDKARKDGCPVIGFLTSAPIYQ